MIFTFAVCRCPLQAALMSPKSSRLAIVPLPLKGPATKLDITGPTIYDSLVTNHRRYSYINACLTLQGPSQHAPAGQQDQHHYLHRKLHFSVRTLPQCILKYYMYIQKIHLLNSM